MRYQQTLTAAADNDALTALYINPTFTNGAFTGVADNGLIVAHGNVGIGSTAPYGTLDVAGVVNINTPPHNAISGYLRIQGAIGNGPAIALMNGDDTTYYSQIYSNNNGFAVTTFRTGSSYTPITMDGSSFIIKAQTGGSHAEAMRVDTTGNVGIGSTSPVASLDLSQKTDALALPSGTTGQRPASG